ncbi:immunoglobulin mu heavy chain-like [Hoplias malabaricus]|uniref:immunoglobulin mu heavy chain-like n=1 Tax=Hoplias malabaricus TaxID=27720 RepID=UPI0034624DEB
MFFTFLLMLTTAVTCVKCDVDLGQPGSMVIKPGDSLTLSCKVSGYSVTDNSYSTGWVRQPVGKPLEWINYIWGGGSTYQKDSLKSRFSISKDASSSTVTLQGQRMELQDTAVYYCVRYRDIYDYFDYWGKGTSVTVTSGGQTKPSPLLGVYQCDSSGDYLSVGCIASGFSPAETLKFTWSSGTSDVVQYPAVQSGGTFSAVSKASVKRTEWDSQKSFTCTAEHPAGTEKLTVVKTSKPVYPPAKPSAYPPATSSCSVQVHTPPAETLPDKVSVLCEVRCSPLGDMNITWLKDQQLIKEGVIVPVPKSVSHISSLSILTVTREEYNANTIYTCSVKQRGMKDEDRPLDQDSTSKRKTTSEPKSGSCIYIDENYTLEEDEYNSLWSTASSFIFLFLFSLIYSTILSLSKKLRKFFCIKLLCKWRWIVYQCDYAFDYWGKGTSVTVITDKPVSIYPMMTCPSSSDVQLGCLSTGLQMDSPVEWTDNNKKSLKEVSPYPAFYIEGSYVKVSVISVAKTDWDNGKQYTCKVSNGKLSIPADKSPKVNLVKVSDGESIMCVIEDFFPKDCRVTWRENGQTVSGQNWPAFRKSLGLYSAASLLRVNETAWRNKVQYSCDVTHQSGNIQTSRSFPSKFTVKVNPPVVKELFVNKKAKMECVVTGDKLDVEGAEISWTVGGNPADKRNIAVSSVEQKEERFTKSSWLTIDDSVWFSGTEVKCSTEQDKFSDKIKIKPGDKSCSVRVNTPDEPVPDKVSLLCEVSCSQLGDVYIMWQKDQGVMEEGVMVQKSENPTSVLSLLTVTREEYNKNTLYTCAVKHSNMEDHSRPKAGSTSKSKSKWSDPGLYFECDKDTLEEDEYNSLWSTASSFIFLFLFSLIYSTILSLSKMKS